MRFKRKHISVDVASKIFTNLPESDCSQHVECHCLKTGCLPPGSMSPVIKSGRPEVEGVAQGKSLIYAFIKLLLTPVGVGV